MASLLNGLLILWLAIFPLVCGARLQSSPPDGLSVRIHPEGLLQVGDVLSFEVFSPPGVDFTQKKLTVSRLVDGLSREIGSAQFGRTSEGGFLATLTWAWDTRDLAEGVYNLRFEISPDNLTWIQPVALASPDPAASSRHRWVRTETACCVLHTITSTPAHRDLPLLVDLVQAQAAAVQAKFGRAPLKKVEINLIPRVIGQGGFAGEELYLSYAEPNYTQTDFAMVLHHELVHRMDMENNRGSRPALFVEGLAVYLTGGHYKAEPVLARAVAIHQLGWGLPLAYLANDFYNHQHEIGYILAGALVDFMVRTWGWEAFLSFYHHIPPTDANREAQAVDSALKSEFGLSLTELDERFSAFLSAQPVIPDVREDLRLTVALFDAIRAYQRQYDPSAHFQQPWLPDASQMRQRDITADYVRGPDQPVNRQIEAQLASAGAFWRAGQFSQAWAALDTISQP